MRALIYHLPLGEMDGTSVVLRRVYAPEAASVRHLFFQPGRFPVPPEFPSEYVQGSPTWRWKKGARTAQKFWQRLVLPSLVNRTRWAAEVKQESSKNGLRSLHVVVYDETTARFAHLALKAAGSPAFTLHLMDLLLETDLTPSKTPHLCWLLAHTSAVAAVSERLLQKVRPQISGPSLVWPIPSGASHGIRSLPDPARPWQVLLGGALYTGKTGFLESTFLPAWKKFQVSHPRSELVYVGKDFDGLPPAIRDNVRFLGVFPPDKIGEVLRAAAIAVLPVLHEASTPWRYSVPARISDYLAAGLPVIAPRSEGTATEDFLLQVGSSAATLVTRQDEVLAALVRLHDAPEQWLSTSQAATAFAQEHLNLDTLRTRLLEFISENASGP
jgi:hypothetical protein